MQLMQWLFHFNDPEFPQLYYYQSEDKNFLNPKLDSRLNFLYAIIFSLSKGTSSPFKREFHGRFSLTRDNFPIERDISPFRGTDFPFTRRFLPGDFPFSGTLSPFLSKQITKQTKKIHSKPSDIPLALDESRKAFSSAAKGISLGLEWIFFVCFVIYIWENII
jgi:hypothetical protein